MAELLDRLREALSGRYRVERELGAGGMAHVYLAEDLKNPRRVAIKVLKPELAAAIGPRRFVREIEIAAGLNHPYILPLLDSGATDDLLYYVMPFVEGESLRARLDREKQLPVDAALEITRDVSEALDYAHSQAIVHRDIKPDNIMLSKGHALVADFGIARAIQAAGGTTTETGMVMGTPGYMSPEQAVGLKVDHRSDIYSLGCAVYEMLTGQTPAPTPVEQAAILRSKAQATPAMAEVLPRALSQSPTDRYETAGAFYRALTAQRRHRLRNVLAATAAAVVILVLAVPAIREPWVDALRGSRAPPSPPDLIMVAEFEGPEDDPALAVGVRDLVVAQLDQSRIVRVLTDAEVHVGLEVAEKPAGTRVSPEVALEIANRKGVKAVVAGRITRLGEGFSTFLHVLNADDGTPLVSLSETAENGDALIKGMDRMTRRLREELGEQKDAIEASVRIPEARTASFAAFRKFSEAMWSMGWGDFRRTIALNREAIALDPGFATAWLNLGITYGNLGQTDSAEVAYKEALKHPERMTKFYRMNLDGFASLTVDRDLPAALAAFNRVIDEFPTYPASYNNRAWPLSQWGRFEEARKDYEKQVEINPFPIPLLVWNQFENLVVLRELDEARRVAGDLRGGYARAAQLVLALAEDNWAVAESLAVSCEADPTLDLYLRARAASIRAAVEAARGEVSAALKSLERFENHSTAAVKAATGYYTLPQWVQLARRAQVSLAALSGANSREWQSAGDENHSTPALITQGIQAVAAGNIGKAQQIVRMLQARPPEELAKFGAGPAWLKASVAASSEQWEEVVRVLGPAARQGIELGVSLWDRAGRVPVRWLVAKAWERLERPDSATVYLELALSPDRLYWEERLQRALYFSYIHQRLVILYAGMGRIEDARRQWQAFSETFIRPDPSVLPLIRAARSALATAEAAAS